MQPQLYQFPWQKINISLQQTPTVVIVTYSAFSLKNGNCFLHTILESSFSYYHLS